jgi:ATP phosphoribosyltransferase
MAIRNGRFFYMNKELDTAPFPFCKEIPRNVDLNELAREGLRLAIPSKGELAKGTISYLSSLGWDTSLLTLGCRKLSVEPSPGVKVFKLRAEDAIKSLRSNVVDVILLGADVICESRLGPRAPSDLVPLNSLGFGECTFRIGFPLDKSTPTENEVFTRLNEGGKIATSLPNILTAIFRQRGYILQPQQLIFLSGGVEIGTELYPEVFAVADRVSSGDTMLQNYLRPDWMLWRSPGAYLVTSKNFYRQRIYQPPTSAYLSIENYFDSTKGDPWI